MHKKTNRQLMTLDLKHGARGHRTYRSKRIPDVYFHRIYEMAQKPKEKPEECPPSEGNLREQATAKALELCDENKKVDLRDLTSVYYKMRREQQSKGAS